MWGARCFLNELPRFTQWGWSNTGCGLECVKGGYDRFFGGGTQRAMAELGHTRQWAGAAPVLVADDDPSSVALIRRFFEAMGLVNPIEVVTRGDDAIEYLTNTAQRPAAVLLDMQMPGASGLEVLRWIRQRDHYAELPVLVLTGSADIDVVNETYALGAVHYLVKPVGFDALGDVMRRLELPWALLTRDLAPEIRTAARPDAAIPAPMVGDRRDRLTGLPDRDAFMERARAWSQPDSDHPLVSLILVELHRFSTINHAFGFDAGDHVISETADRLRMLAGDSCFLARVGSDVFGLLCDDNESCHAADLAAAIESEAAPIAPGIDASVATSPLLTIGVATTCHGEGVDALLQRAETALHLARAQGGNGVEVYRPEVHGPLLDRRRLELDLFGAGVRKELRVHYQPLIDLRTGDVVGFEALVRWDRPGHGLLQPASFIEAAEDCGAILYVGASVLEEACRQALEWNTGSGTPVVVSVNVSAHQLRARRFVESVAAIIDSVGIDPQGVTLEITETALMSDIDAMIGVLARLKELGVLLALDDFGTGYSSLNYLRRLPVDYVKIDRAFVSGIASDSEEWALGVAIVKVATSLGKRTLAEGIETAAQLAHLRSLGCDLGQGYLFARPLEADAAEAFLSNANVGGHVGVGGGDPS